MKRNRKCNDLCFLFRTHFVPNVFIKHFKEEILYWKMFSTETLLLASWIFFNRHDDVTFLSLLTTKHLWENCTTCGRLWFSHTRLLGRRWVIGNNLNNGTIMFIGKTLDLFLNEQLDTTVYLWRINLTDGFEFFERRTNGRGPPRLFITFSFNNTFVAFFCSRLLSPE